MWPKAVKKRKASWLLLSILSLFILVNSLFGERYLRVINEQTNIITKSTALLLICWIVLSSFYACYHICSFFFSLTMKRKNSPQTEYFSTPDVAILYPCMNDFKEKAVSSYLNQEYVNFHIFVLDDSTCSKEKEKIDKYQKTNEGHITIIRRQDRKHYKAGNLNNALRCIKERFKYFAVMDSDEIVPSNFLTETVAVAEANPSYGFIQTSHTQYGETPYAEKTGDSIDLHWNYFLPARNEFGFVYFYGHGALIRTKACFEAGGFPEIVAEDVALATRLRQLGYEGYHLDKIVCMEETPKDYHAWRKRQGKVAKGTLEFITKEFWSFAKSKKVPWVEKIDLAISSSIIYLPVLFLGFILLLHIILPLFYADSYSLSSPWMYDAKSGYIHTAEGIFKPLWGWDTLVFTLFVIFSPLCYIIPVLIKKPLKVFKYIWYMNTINLSNTINISSEIVEWLYKRKAVFNPTGDKTEKKIITRWNKIESLLGIGFLLVGISSASLCLMAIGLSIFLVPVLLKRNLQGKPYALLALLPMTLIVIAFGFVPFSLLGFTGLFAGVALAHH